MVQPYRQIPPTQYGVVREHISKLLRKGVIKESISAYASPIVLVRKADGTLRICVDYRKLNAKTRQDAFPLPRIDKIFDALRGKKLFLTIDLAGGITRWQCRRRTGQKRLSPHPLGYLST